MKARRRVSVAQQEAVRKKGVPPEATLQGKKGSKLFRGSEIIWKNATWKQKVAGSRIAQWFGLGKAFSRAYRQQIVSTFAKELRQSGFSEIDEGKLESLVDREVKEGAKLGELSNLTTTGKKTLRENVRLQDKKAKKVAIKT